VDLKMQSRSAGIAGARIDIASDRAADAPSRSVERRFGVALGGIALLGLAWRVAYVLWMRNGTVLGDGYTYHYGALDLVDGVGFYDPTTGRAVAGHPPAWTIVLAGPSALGLRSWFSHQLVACVIGTATIVMSGLAAREAFGRRTGLIAGALTAAYPYVWLYEREVLAEPLAMLGAATTIWLAYKFRATPRLGPAIALGAAVGIMAMTRSELIGIAVLLIAPLVLSVPHVQFRRRLCWVSAAALACVLVIAPWAVYNSTRFARPVPLSTGLGAAMQTGNCEPTYHGELLGYYELGCLIFFVEDINSDYSVADGQYRRTALRFMSENKSRVPIVIAARVGRTFGLYRPLQQMHLETERATDLWVLRLGFVSYWALLPLAIAGAAIARRRRVPIYPLLAFPFLIAVSVLLTIGSVRYRAPAEIPLLILAAVAVDAAWTRWRRHRATDSPLAR
jgi:4-amino-4-deoxy-L-arabinose transferase-like glycosyltransferase